MKVTQSQFDRVKSIMEQLRQDGTETFNGDEPRMVNWLVTAEEKLKSLKPSNLDLVRDLRTRLAMVFEEHELHDELCRELLRRILVLGFDQIFTTLRAVKDPVEIVPDEEEYSAMFVARTKAVTDQLSFTFERKKLLAVIVEIEPFRSQQGRIDKELNDMPFDWKIPPNHDSHVAGARANRKSFPKDLCEDNIVIANMQNGAGKTFRIAGAMDGISLDADHVPSNNVMKWIFNELLGHHIKKCFESCLTQSRGFPAKEKLITALLTAVEFAQDEMKAIIPKLSTCFQAYQKENHVRRRTPRKALSNAGTLIQDYLRVRSGATTLEMVIACPELGKGVGIKVGDGQTLLMTERGTFREIGPNNKMADHSTAGIAVIRYQDLLESALKITSFTMDPDDALLVTTDGLGDNFPCFDPSPDKRGVLDFFQQFRTNGKQHIAKMVRESKQAEEAITSLCDLIDNAELKKPDDFGFVVIR